MGSAANERPILSGVRVPLANASFRRDTSEATLGELKLQLVHARADAHGAESAAAQAAAQALVHAYTRAGGRVLPPVVLPLLEDAAVPSAVAAAASSVIGEGGEHAPAQLLALPSASPSPSPSPVPHAAAIRRKPHQQTPLRTLPARQHSSFQLYAAAGEDAPAVGRNNRGDGDEKRAMKAQSPALQLLRQCVRHCATLLSSPSSLLSPQFRTLLDWPALGAVDFSSLGASAGADGPVIRAMKPHPSAPVLAILRKDEVLFYDTLPAVGGMAAAAIGSSAPSTALTFPSAAGDRASSGGASSSAVLPGAWVGRTLRHPLMALSLSLAWGGGVGGGVVAVGTAAGLVCLWQLVSAPDAAAAQAQAQAQAQGIASAGAPPRRLGAWLHVLSHPSQSGRAVTQLCFSPCGRWLVSACDSTPCVLLWDVSAALASPSLEAPQAAAAVLTRPGSSLLDKTLLGGPASGVDLLRFSPRGDVLAVATSRRSRGALRAVKDWWTGANASRVAEAKGSESAVSATAAAELGPGTLTVWDSVHWQNRTSFDMATPVADLAFSASAGAGGRGGAAVALLALKGSSVVQSVELSVPASSPSASSSSARVGPSGPSSAVRLDFRLVEGLPPSRLPAEAEKKFLLGGNALAKIAWSASGSRVVALVEQPHFASKGALSAEDQEAELDAAQLAAVVALQRDATRSLQGLAVGAVRGPVCPCRGRVHPRRPRNQEPSSDDERLERKYAEDSDAQAAENDAEDADGFTCSAPNPPLHACFLRASGASTSASSSSASLGLAGASAAAGELLAIGWKYGQVTFVPLGAGGRQG